MKSETSVGIANGFDLVRAGLVHYFHSVSSFEFLWSAESPESLFGQLHATIPDFLVIDPSSEGFSIADLEKIRKEYPQIKLLLISGSIDRKILSESMKLGVAHFVLNECSREEMLDACNHLLEGKDFMCGKIVDFLASPAGALRRKNCEGVSLSERELDVLRLIAEGYSNKQMADILFLSQHTINTHRKNIMSKLNINNTAGLVMFAVKENLLDRNKFLFS